MLRHWRHVLVGLSLGRHKVSDVSQEDNKMLSSLFTRSALKAAERAVGYLVTTPGDIGPLSLFSRGSAAGSRHPFLSAGQ